MYKTYAAKYRTDIRKPKLFHCFFINQYRKGYINLWYSDNSAKIVWFRNYRYKLFVYNILKGFKNEPSFIVVKFLFVMIILKQKRSNDDTHRQSK